MKLIRLTSLVLAVLMLFSCIACSSGFEKERSSVVDYLKAFDGIDNDFNSTVSNLTNNINVNNILAVSSALNQVINAGQGALQRLNDLKVPDISEVKSQYTAYKNIAQEQNTDLQNLKTAINNGDQKALNQATTALMATYQEVSAVHRQVESIIVKYNITDSEVNYQFRGK